MEIQNIGRIYEKKCVEVLKKAGYYVHLTAIKKEGQPCDLICYQPKLKKFMLIDVKHCKDRRFNLGLNIKYNQIDTFKLATELGVDDSNCGFAIYSEFLQRWIFLSYKELKNIDIYNLKRLNLNNSEIELKDFEYEINN